VVDSISEMTPENVEARRDVELVITKLDDGQVRVPTLGRPAPSSCTSGCARHPAALPFARLEKSEVGPFEYLTDWS